MADKADSASFLGRGWSFPPRFDLGQNKLEMVETEDDIRESLYIILSTPPGERVINPDFGCRVHDMIHDTISQSTINQIKGAIRDAVLQFEPRVDLEEIHIDTDDREGTVFVHLDYTIKRINVRTNIVYPYYKIEGTDIVAV